MTLFHCANAGFCLYNSKFEHIWLVGALGGQLVGLAQPPPLKIGLTNHEC